MRSGTATSWSCPPATGRTGGTIATAARYRGARGIVADAYARDTIALIDMEFRRSSRAWAPTFSRPIDVSALNVPIKCGGVSIDAGDFVLADHDGVVVVPRAAAEDAIRAAEEKVAGENVVRESSPRACRCGNPFARTG